MTSKDPHAGLVPTPNQHRLVNLPNNQWNVIVLLARGMTFDRIAQETGYAPRSVKLWCDRLRMLLDVQTANEIPYAYYLRTGNCPMEMDLRE